MLVTLGNCWTNMGLERCPIAWGVIWGAEVPNKLLLATKCLVHVLLPAPIIATFRGATEPLRTRWPPPPYPHSPWPNFDPFLTRFWPEFEPLSDLKGFKFRSKSGQRVVKIGSGWVGVWGWGSPSSKWLCSSSESRDPTIEKILPP